MMTLKNSSDRANTFEWRNCNLEISKWCLERYKETKEEEYLKLAKEYGDWSDKIKKEWLDK